MKNCRLFGLLALLLVIVGCGGGNKLVGTWEGSEGGANMAITFNADNTFSMDASSPMAPGQGMNATGTYKLEGEKVTMNLSDMKMGGKSMKDEPMFKDQLAKPMTATVVFKGDTEVEFTPDNGPKQTLKKKA